MTKIWNMLKKRRFRFLKQKNYSQNHQFSFLELRFKSFNRSASAGASVLACASFFREKVRTASNLSLNRCTSEIQFFTSKKASFFFSQTISARKASPKRKENKRMCFWKKNKKKKTSFFAFEKQSSGNHFFRKERPLQTSNFLPLLHRSSGYLNWYLVAVEGERWW